MLFITVKFSLQCNHNNTYFAFNSPLFLQMITVNLFKQEIYCTIYYFKHLHIKYGTSLSLVGHDFSAPTKDL